MILVLYNAALVLALLVSAPWWIWRLLTTEKYREGLQERLGRVRVLKAGDGGRNGRPVIWVHAVSVGEVLAVSRLVRALDEEIPEYFVVISTTTRTGQAVARERFGSERIFYSPLDLPWAVRAHLRALEPKMLVLAESEFWPNLLFGCFRRGIPVLVVNARVSDRSWPRYWRLRALWRPILKRLSMVLAQSGIDAERLSKLGCARIKTAGNLKFDVRSSGESAATTLLTALRGDLRFVVAGSTLEDEEAALLEAWPEMLAADPKLAMVVAPRHPERFGAVADLLSRSGFAWRRRSAMGAGSGDEPLRAGEVVLLDSMGELATVYSMAAVAFVGGSLVPAGGHNPLEPAQFGVPVVMGEHYANFREIVQLMNRNYALRTTSRKHLGARIAAILRDPDEARQIGHCGKRIFEEQAGATERTVQALREILEGRR